MVRFALPLFIFMVFSAAKGQNFLSWQYYDRYFTVMASTGPTTYFGELNPNNGISPGFNHATLGLEARLWRKVSARVTTSYYQISGDDALAPLGSYRRQRNLSFRSNNFEAALLGVFFLKPYRLSFTDRWGIDPYLATGIGFSTNNPTTLFSGERVSLPDSQTEGVAYARVIPIIPISAGLKFKVTEFINLNMEAAFRFTFTDYLDDVSTVYLDGLGDTRRGLLANRKDEVRILNREAYDALVPGAPRGNPNNNDHYLFLSMGVEVFLPKAKGPIFKKPSAYKKKTKARKD